MKLPKITSLMAFLLLFFMIPNAHALTLKIATLSPDGSMWMEKMREGAAEVAQKTQNRVKIKYYPGGVMGDDKAVLRKIRIGQLHGGAVVSGSLSAFFPDIQIYSLPMKFRSSEEIDHVRKHMDPLILSGLEKGGFVTFGVAEGGFAYVMSNTRVQSFSDMRTQKVWIPDNDPTALEVVKALGISPIPLSIADVRAGLQTGLINTVTAPPIGTIALQWHTQVKYLLDLPFIYTYAVLSVDKKAFSKISPEDQPIVRETMTRVFQEIDQENRKDNVKATEALRKQGIEFVSPGDKATAEWRAKASEVSENLIKKGELTQEIVDILDKHLREANK